MTSQDIAEISGHVVCMQSLGDRAARQKGLGPREYELLLALKGLPRGTRPGIGEMAERLGMQGHNVVELVARLEHRGLLRREPDQHDRRRPRLVLTRKGTRILWQVVMRERKELCNLAAEVVSSFQRVVENPVGGGKVAGACNGRPRRRARQFVLPTRNRDG